MAFGRKKTAPVEQAVADQSVAPATPFLGVLRSEYDTPAAVAEEFARVGQVTNLVANAYQRGLLSANVAGELLSGLKLATSEGFEWRFGTATKRWYRRSGDGVWRVALPPESVNEDLSSAVHEADEVLEELMEAVAGAQAAALAVDTE